MVKLEADSTTTRQRMRAGTVLPDTRPGVNLAFIAVGKFPAPWGGTWRRCKASRVAVPHLTVLAPGTPPLAAGCFIQQLAANC